MNKCDVIQPLIIKNHVDDITNEELIFVKEHLKSCKKCRHYESTLKNLHNSMQTGKSQKLVPNPNIRQTLLSQLKPHKTTRLDIFGNIWQNITRIFEYRIPVYQAVLGLTFAFLVFFTINQVNHLDSQIFSGDMSTTTVDSTNFINVTKTLEMAEQQKIGRNIYEDSLLTRFIVTDM